MWLQHKQSNEDDLDHAMHMSELQDTDNKSNGIDDLFAEICNHSFNIISPFCYYYSIKFS